MRLYQSVGPNPRVVLMYLAEKQIDLPRRFVDIMGGENRRADYLALNPAGGVPLLELDDGSHLPESIAICEYLEEQHPVPPLIGTTAEARAQTRSLMRWIDQAVVVPMTAGFRGAEGLAMFKDRMLCAPDAAPGNKALAADGLKSADRKLAAGPYLAGDRFTLADILLFCWVEFGAQVGQPVDPALAHLAAWRTRVGDRPAAAISTDARHGVADAVAA